MLHFLFYILYLLFYIYKCLLNFLKQEEEKKIETDNGDANSDVSYDFIDKHPLLSSLVLWYKRFGNDNINDKYKYEFMKNFMYLNYIQFDTTNH